MTGREDLMACSLLADRAAWAGYVEELILSNSIETSGKLQLTNSLTNCVLLENTFMYFQFKRSMSLWSEVKWYGTLLLRYSIVDIVAYFGLAGESQWAFFLPYVPFSSSQVCESVRWAWGWGWALFCPPSFCCWKCVPLCLKCLVKNSH